MRERERETRSSSLTIKGMHLGNLISQFFANVYLNELDQFVKHKLKAKYYIRYVDDFVILHKSKIQLEIWKSKINTFLKEKLNLELHKNKSKITNINSGINFLGFRIFYNYKLLRKSNQRNFEKRLNQMKFFLKEGIINKEKAINCFEGWLAYCSHADTYKYKIHLINLFSQYFNISKRGSNSKRQKNFIKKIDESNLEFSVQRTLFLFKNGWSIKEIAQKRIIKESTVWKHLINLIEHNQLSLLRILSKYKIYKIVSNVKSKKDTLKIIKNRIKDNSITYDEIACVLATIKKRR